MAKLTFRQWLKQQRYRNDRIGDLARDFAEDGCARRLRSVKSIRRHILFDHNPCVGAQIALEEAVAEYTERFGRNDDKSTS
jgi:hypothetical protein